MPSPRERIESALRWERPDVVPFSMYETKVFPCEAERLMRNRGMCIVDRKTPVYRTHSPNVKVRFQSETLNGAEAIRTVYETPRGVVTSLHQDMGFTSWRHEKLLKRPEDYEAIAFMIADQRFEADYGPIAQKQAAWGGDAIMRADLGLEPLQTLISGPYLDMNTFCLEWMERRDEVLRLYELIVQKRREVYPIVAESPALISNYGGNVTVPIIGPQVFRDYYLPHYHEAAELLHRHGKLIGVHCDADCGAIRRDIASTDLDYIEAFTPWPDTDMTVAEARAAWPDKVLWLNYPSSVHLHSDQRVRQTAVELLDQADQPEGLIMAVTEDVPIDRWRQSCTAIMDGLDEHRRRRPGLYAAA